MGGGGGAPNERAVNGFAAFAFAFAAGARSGSGSGGGMSGNGRSGGEWRGGGPCRARVNVVCKVMVLQGQNKFEV